MSLSFCDQAVSLDPIAVSIINGVTIGALYIVSRTRIEQKRFRGSAGEYWTIRLKSFPRSDNRVFLASRKLN
jgi:hypothetical protein